MNKIKISQDFSLYEFQCKDGSYLVKLDSRLVDKLQMLRDKLGVPLTINSGYRTPEHNEKVKGSPTSQHLLGKAADISTRNISMPDEKLIDICKALDFDGIGIYDTFIHLDTRGYKHYFDLRTKKEVVVMKKGSKGNEVKELQMKLNELGYNAGVTDGIFGNGTDKAVKSFQKDNKLTIDGIVGPATLKILETVKKK